jgi:hypothetical protein
MVGCTRRQMTWRVMVPSAMQSLMVGINQVIMLSLNMVIIASMIGAGGLGFEVLTRCGGSTSAPGSRPASPSWRWPLRSTGCRQALARAPRAAACAAGRCQCVVQASLHLCRRCDGHPHAPVGTVLPALQTFPEAWRLTTGTSGRGRAWINVNYFRPARGRKERGVAQRPDPVQALSDRFALAWRGRPPGVGRLVAGRLAAGAADRRLARSSRFTGLNGKRP